MMVLSAWIIQYLAGAWDAKLLTDYRSVNSGKQEKLTDDIVYVDILHPKSMQHREAVAAYSAIGTGIFKQSYDAGVPKAIRIHFPLLHMQHSIVFVNHV